MLPWKLRKRQILPVNQNLSSVYFSPAKFQLVSSNLSLATIWQKTHSQSAKTVFSHLKFLYSVKPTQRHDDIVISTRRLLRKLFSFYTVIISYIAKRGHHNVVVLDILLQNTLLIISNKPTVETILFLSWP